MTSYFEKLSALRTQMQTHHIDAYIIPSSDPHISEYLPDHYKCIAWLSGFTGSAGTLVITKKFAGLWTDSRYFVQAKQQLTDSGFELVKLQVQHAPEFIDWIQIHIEKGTVAFDGSLTSTLLAQTIIQQLRPKGFTIDGNLDLLSPIWTNRLDLPKAKAYTLPLEITGESTIEKVERIRDILKQKHIDFHVVSSLDDIAWILNVRGTDVPCNPVVLSYLLISQTEVNWFVDSDKLTEDTLREIQSYGIHIQPYSGIRAYLSRLPEQSKILIDTKRSCFGTYNAIAPHVEIVEATNPSTHFKAIKNTTEIQHQKETMIKDGIALTRFFMWLETHLHKDPLTEISIAEKLYFFRAQQEGFKDISFDTIAGYKDHGALPHYKADENNNYLLQAEGLLLIDSGGQYLTGTTDITRVIPLGIPLQEEKEDYTLVLKSMIEGSMAVFPTGTRGYQIDAIARRPLWTTQRNYLHGTGHGVGFFLNVHEGPHSFNPTPLDIPIVPGMITSMEPGLYRVGKHGIRIENLLLAKELGKNEFGSFLDFETLTLCYIDTSLIERSLLEDTHIQWLNAYHKRIYTALKEHLTKEEAQWLETKTKAI